MELVKLAARMSTLNHQKYLGLITIVNSVQAFLIIGFL